jgi:hypothetical protein
MADASTKNFGLVVAYLVPGFIGLAGAVPLFPVIGTWLQPVQQGEMGFGPPIYALIAAAAVGLIISCFRWLSVDQIHHWTGVRRPVWDDSQLERVLSSFDYLVQSHFRYYEFCGNTLIASLWAYGVNRTMKTLPTLGLGTDLGIVILSLVLFTASRDALSKYFKRTGLLVGHVAEKGQEGDPMFNGNHHESEAGAAPEKRPTPNKSEKPEATKVKPASKEGEAGEAKLPK